MLVAFIVLCINEVCCVSIAFVLFALSAMVHRCMSWFQLL